jgi:hypothetical protein
MLCTFATACLLHTFIHDWDSDGDTEARFLHTVLAIPPPTAAPQANTVILPQLRCLGISKIYFSWATEDDGGLVALHEITEFTEILVSQKKARLGLERLMIKEVFVGTRGSERNHWPSKKLRYGAIKRLCRAWLTSPVLHTILLRYK